MTRRGNRAVLGALLLLTVVAASPPATSRPHSERRGLDLVASAQPSPAQPGAVDTAFDARKVWSSDVKADAVATTSAVCDGCTGESTTLQVLYVPSARRATLDNTATAWAQACAGCTSTALSVQVVVLRGRPQATPNNRALSVTASCTGCRTASAAFQVVVVARRATALSGASLAELRAWFGEQAAELRALVAEGPVLPPEPTTTPTPTPTPTPSPTPTPTLAPTAVPTDRTIQPPNPTRTSHLRTRRAKQDATAALTELAALVTQDLGAITLSTDVELAR